MQEDFENIFFEWRELFTEYRNKGKLSDSKRKKFIRLSAKLKEQGIIEDKPIMKEEQNV